METDPFKASRDAFERAKNVLPGGVNSPARSYAAVEGPPPFIERAEGAHIEDIDGNEYVDMVGSWGPMIFGHNPPDIKQAVVDEIEDGMSFGAPTEIETEMAETVAEMIPSIDVIRFVNSGTEATMSALRLARGATGRDKILKFQGCYHGHGDSLLVEAGSGSATLGEPDSAGVPEDLARLTVSVPYGDEAAVREAFDRHGDELACVILEPVAGNMGLIHPSEEFLQFLRDITETHGSLLIFDEVMTGFRVGEAGVQSHVDVKPDITTLGKIIGGGLPVGAYGGREEVMRHVAPDGPVYQAGTLSGNPVAMRCGLETLRTIRKEDPYPELKSIIDRIEEVFRRETDNRDIPLQFHRLGGMFSYYFTENDVTDYESASTTDEELFSQFHGACLREGLYFPPSFYESSFVSTCHADLMDEIDDSLSRAFDRIG